MRWGKGPTAGVHNSKGIAELDRSNKEVLVKHIWISVQGHAFFSPNCKYTVCIRVKQAGKLALHASWLEVSKVG